MLPRLWLSVGNTKTSHQQTLGMQVPAFAADMSHERCPEELAFKSCVARGLVASALRRVSDFYMEICQVEMVHAWS